jgi:hypothetical protein
MRKNLEKFVEVENPNFNTFLLQLLPILPKFWIKLKILIQIWIAWNLLT